jgi:hypothetical protein
MWIDPNKECVSVARNATHESEPMTPSEIMNGLARDDIFPKAAMVAARADRETMVPIFVDLINRLGIQPIAAMKDDEVIALIPIFHMLGEWRDQRAYRPLVHLLR